MEVFIFDMGKPVKIIDLARNMIRLAGFIPDKEIEIQVVGLRPGRNYMKNYSTMLQNNTYRP
jgi:FlaA1/EpsC-like NDP-sugar epimerase